VKETCGDETCEKVVVPSGSASAAA